MAPYFKDDREPSAVHLLSPEEWTTGHLAKRPGGLGKRWFNLNFDFPQGWRFSVTCGAVLASLVFLLNLVTTVYVQLKHGDDEDRRNVIFDGDCDDAKKLNTLVHLLINALSTVLLSTSNYAMQCLTGPTRKEIDAAHAKRRWLDIGVLSMRNLKSIGRKRVIIWLILGASSLPLHILYNSAVYSVMVANDYVVFSATPQMLEDRNTSRPLGMLLVNEASFSQRKYHATAKRLLDEYWKGQLDRLENSACISEYASTFLTTRSDIILVYTKNATSLQAAYQYDTYDATIGSADARCEPDPYSWICGDAFPRGSCSGAKSRSVVCSAKIPDIDAAGWTPYPNEAASPAYCLSKPVAANCALRFSPHIAWTVIAFNFLKVLALAYTTFSVQETPLLTFGDAVASFLSRPDETTRGFCLMGKADTKRWTNPELGSKAYDIFSVTRVRWRNAVSTTRWWVCLSLYFTVLSVCTGLFCIGLSTGIASSGELMSVGLGDPDPRTFIMWNVPSRGLGALLANVIIANTPQLVLSGVYYTYNGVFTTYWLAKEGIEYAVKRKSLRVSSSKRGAQRTSYFLQLPYRFGIPLIVISGLLHWLCSQSIYLVVVKPGSTGEYISCGYSPPAILAVIIIGLTVVAGMILAGRRQFRSAMPVAASCSASISALCHPPPKEHDQAIATGLVRWGVTANVDESCEAPNVGHCSFSSEEVGDPVEGMPYAGSGAGPPFFKALTSRRRHH